MRFLLVEDNELDQEAICRDLRELFPEASITTLSSGRRLHEELETHAYDLALIDYKLPGGNGLNLIAALAANPQRFPPAILLTGIGGEDIAVRALKLGAVDFLNKNKLTQDSLKITIDAAIEKHSLKIQLAQYQAKLERLALTDELTGVGNRAAFNQEAERRIAEAQRNARGFWILIIDLDKFKPVNDELGHQAGDLVLQEVARRLQGTCRDSDSSFRIGGDEFAVLAEDGGAAETATFIARRIGNVLSSPILLADNKTVTIGASVGSAFAPRDGDTLSELMHYADQAMYKHKRRSAPPPDQLSTSG